MMWPKYKNDASSVWLFPTVFLSILQYISANLTAEECRSLGFTPNLLCSTCDELPQFKLESLVENCNGCCQADQNETAVEKVCLKQLVMEIRSVGSVVDVCVLWMSCDGLLRTLPSYRKTWFLKVWYFILSPLKCKKEHPSDKNWKILPPPKKKMFKNSKVAYVTLVITPSLPSYFTISNAMKRLLY